VLIEARILCGNYCVLEIGRDLAERNEFVAFMIRSAMNPDLQVALDVYCGCRRVDPPGGQQDECRERPDKHHPDSKPSNQGSEKILAKRWLGTRVWFFSHISE
jgi:hypothetical protein